jgi:iron complex outermembrane receptor protein
MRKFIHRASVGAAATALAAIMFMQDQVVAQTAGSEDKIEAIVVTARRRAEDIQKVPLTVTALDQTDLKRLQINTAADLKFIAPSLNTSSAYGGSGVNYSIRGFTGGLSGSSVTSYFSEVPSTAPSGGVPLFDMASVQVLAGPQGTLFGRATTGGAIVFTPQHPDFNNWEGSIDVVGGSQGRSNVTAILNMPIIDDQLALRVSYHREHLDGYTSFIGASGSLDETNSNSVRIGLEWQPTSSFSNYLVFSGTFVNEASGAPILSGFDPNFQLFNLPPDTSTPLGAIYGNALFGGLCTAAVSDGLSPSTTACENQRLGLLAALKPALTAELARTAGGGSSLRRTNLSPGFPSIERSNAYQFVDNASWDLGDLGFSNVVLKNNFSYSLVNGFHCVDGDSIVAALVQTCFATGTNLASAHAVQVGNRIVPGTGPLQGSYSEEFQITGNYDDNLLVWLLGAYYAATPAGRDTSGCANMNKVLDGTLTENLGAGCAYTMPVSGNSWERGFFGNTVVDLRDLAPGLHLTLGVRTTTDETSSTTAAPLFIYPSGTLVQGPITTFPVVKSSGMGWTAAVDYQVNDDVMVYATANRGYKPGGRNSTVGSTGAPGFTATFAPEAVVEYEVGAKTKFEFGGVQGIFNADFYHNAYTNIQEPLIARVGSSTFNYTENVAGAILQGVELETTLIPTDDIQIMGNYAYNDSHYSKFFAADPLGVAGPGNPACYGPLSTPTFCVLDLHNNPFPNTTKHQGHLTFRYLLPTPENIGPFHFSLTGYVQSREYFTSSAQREVQVYGPTLGAVNVRKADSQAAYATLNARLDWDNIYGSDISGSLWVNNLTNQTYSTGSLNNVTIIAALGIWAKTYAPPRTFGIELSYQFGQ